MQELKEINKMICTSKRIYLEVLLCAKEKNFVLLQPFDVLKGIMYVKQKNTLKKERKNSIMKNIFKNVKRIAAGILAVAVMMTGAAFATESAALVINGEVVEGANVITKDDMTFVPVRALCEALGMEVMWDNDAELVTIEKMPLYVTFSPVADAYTFAKTAPMQLGSAPFLKNDRTYVPAIFISEILKQEFTFAENGDVNVTAIIDNSVGAIIVETSSENGNLTITVDDSKRGEEVVVNITEETVIVDENGAALTADALVKDASIKVEYADFMTMSIPPITNAVKIQVMGVVAETEIAPTVYTIIEKNDENGTITIFDGAMNSKVVLNVSEETLITDKDGNKVGAEVLAIGTDITVERADFMTMSIPPITNALNIKLAEKETITVLEKDTEGKTITIFDKEMKSLLVLNISESTVLKDAEGNAVKFEDISAGTELASVEHAEAMTRSIPPITNATSIVVAK